MIDVRRDGVMLHFESVVHGYKHTFSFNTGTGWACELLYWAIRDRLNKKLEAIRSEAYEQGWKDAKAKRTKKKHFNSWW